MNEWVNIKNNLRSGLITGNLRSIKHQAHEHVISLEVPSDSSSFMKLSMHTAHYAKHLVLSILHELTSKVRINLTDNHPRSPALIVA